MGPERGTEVLVDRLNGIPWAATGIGNGVRSARLEQLIVWFEGQILYPIASVRAVSHGLHRHDPDFPREEPTRKDHLQLLS